MSRTVKELKAILGKLESISARLENAGFDKQAKELDEASETVEGLMQDLDEL